MCTSNTRFTSPTHKRGKKFVGRPCGERLICPLLVVVVVVVVFLDVVAVVVVGVVVVGGGVGVAGGLSSL